MRVLMDKWVDKGMTYKFTSQENITITIENNSVSNKRLRIALVFKRGRKKKGDAMANPKVNADGEVEGIV